MANSAASPSRCGGEGEFFSVIEVEAPSDWGPFALYPGVYLTNMTILVI